jgi:CRP-like cAMP-binding protein
VISWFQSLLFQIQLVPLHLGEVSVLEGSAPTATVLAMTDVQTISLDRAAFKRMLGDEVIAAMTVRSPGAKQQAKRIEPNQTNPNLKIYDIPLPLPLTLCPLPLPL